MEARCLSDSSLLVRLAGTTILVGADHGASNAADIDVVLLANATEARHLPTLMRYERFTGSVYATEPVKHIVRTVLYEVVALAPQTCAFGADDVDACLDDTHSVSYRQRVRIGPELIAEPVSSGFGLGAANWILRTPFESIAIVMESSTNFRRYPSPMDVTALADCDVVLVSPGARPESMPEASQALLNLCSIIDASLKQSGSVLVPVAPWSLTFDLFEFLSSFLNAKALGHVGMYWVSPAAPTAIAYWALMGEWLNDQKQACLMEGRSPLSIDDLIAKKKLQVFARAADERFTEALQEPAVIFFGVTNSEAGNITLLLQRYGDDPNCALIQIEPGSSATPVANGAASTLKTYQCPIDIRMSLSDYAQLLSQCVKCRTAVLPADYETGLNPASTFNVVWYERDQTVTIDLKKDLHALFIDAELAKSLPFDKNPIQITGRLHFSDIIRLTPDQSRTPQSRRLAGVLTINRLMTAMHDQGYTDAIVISTDSPTLGIEESLTVEIDIPSLEAQVLLRIDKATIRCRHEHGRCAIAKVIQGLLLTI